MKKYLKNMAKKLCLFSKKMVYNCVSMEKNTYTFSGLIRECLKKHRPDSSKETNADWKADLNYWIPLYEKTFFKSLGIADFYAEYKEVHHNKFNEEWFDFIEKIFLINSPSEEDKTAAAMKAKKDLRVPLNLKHSILNYNYDELFKLLSNAISKSGDDAQTFLDKLNKTDLYIKRYREFVESKIYSRIEDYLFQLENDPDLSNEEKRDAIIGFYNSVSNIMVPGDDFVGFAGYTKTSDDILSNNDSDNSKQF